MTTAPADADAILGKLQHAYDVVKKADPREIELDDHLVDDLELDSLDIIDLVSVLEDEFPAEVVDAVIDKSPEISTVRQLVEALAAS